MKAGDRVKVDFVGESATIYSGKRFTGYGVLDRVEDGRVFGRLDDGTPFSCFTGDVEVIQLVDRTEEFEAFFTAQPFFKNLRFIHGDKLFDFDKGIGYRNLTVQVGYVCFCKGDGEVIQLVDRTEEFEAFFTAQPFFKNLRFIHGDKLFDFDKGIGYRNLTVQVGYVCFCKGDGEFVLND